MRKFEISTAASSCFTMFKQHGLKIALAQILMLAAIFGFILFLFLDVVLLFSVTMFENPEMLVDELGSTISNLVVGVIVAFALMIAGYFIGWRIALSHEEETFLGSMGYGIIAAFPALFALIAVYLALIVTLLVVGLIFGRVGGSNLLMGAAASGVSITIILFSIGAFISTLFLLARLGTAGPIMAAKRSYNPFRALADSWRLTQNNSLMIMLFLFLAFIGFSLLQLALGYIIGLVATASTAIGFILLVANSLAFLTLYVLVPAGIYDALINKNVGVDRVFD